MNGTHYDDCIEQAPEIIQCCLECKRIDCTGECAKVRDMIDEAPKKRRNRYTATKYLDENGNPATLRELAECHGKTVNFVRSRMRMGASLQEALRAEPTRGKLYAALGMEKTLKEWAEWAGVCYNTFRNRMHMSDDDIEYVITHKWKV